MQQQTKHVYLVRRDASTHEETALIKVGSTSNLFATLSRLAEALDGVTVMGIVEGDEALAARVCEVLASVALEATSAGARGEDQSCFVLTQSTAKALRLSLAGSLADVMARQWSRIQLGPADLRARQVCFLTDVMRGCPVERSRVYSLRSSGP